MFIPERCQQCWQNTPVIMSMYDTRWICSDCKDAEKKRPDYDLAVAKDLRSLAGRMEDPRVAASIRQQADDLVKKFEEKR